MSWKTDHFPKTRQRNRDSQFATWNCWHSGSARRTAVSFKALSLGSASTAVFTRCSQLSKFIHLTPRWSGGGGDGGVGGARGEGGLGGELRGVRVNTRRLNMSLGALLLYWKPGEWRRLQWVGQTPSLNMHALRRLPQLEPSAGFRSGVSTCVLDSVHRPRAARRSHDEQSAIEWHHGYTGIDSTRHVSESRPNERILKRKKLKEIICVQCHFVAIISF